MWKECIAKYEIGEGKLVSYMKGRKLWAVEGGYRGTMEIMMKNEGGVWKNIETLLLRCDQ